MATKPPTRVFLLVIYRTSYWDYNPFYSYRHRKGKPQPAGHLREKHHNSREKGHSNSATKTAPALYLEELGVSMAMAYPQMDGL